MALLTIETRYVQATSYRGAFLKAEISGNTSKENSATSPYSYAHSNEENHLIVADKLAQHMGWDGKLFGGNTNKGMVFVVPDKQATFEIGEWHND